MDKIKYTQASLKFDAKNLKYNQNGYLMIDAFVAKEGIVSRVLDGQTRNEYVSENALFDSTSMDTLMGIPVTQYHPMMNGKRVLLDNENTKMFQRGFSVGMPEKVKMDGNTYLKIPLMITDKNVIEDVVNNRTPEVSLGYTSVDIPMEGNFKGNSYNFVQTNRINNHIALDLNGMNRSGSDVRVKTDSKDNDDFVYYDDVKGEGQKMATIKLDSKDYEVTDVVKLALENQLKTDSKAIADLQAEKSVLSNEVDKLKGKVEEQKETITKLDSYKDKFEQQELDTLKNQVIPILGKEFKFDGLSSLDVKKQALVKQNPKLDLANQSTGYIEGRFESMIENFKYDSNDRQAFDVKEFARNLPDPNQGNNDPFGLNALFSDKK